MIPTHLSVRNFLSYGDDVAALDFRRFHIACLTGNNGHGKSALLDAMTYALWGEARKSSFARRPDEGLLRIGANEMRVEFGFELEQDHFRIIRSFRRGRSTSPQLELQVFDPGSTAYRSLSEGSSLTRTQTRINQLLSMDYQTFTNSAFILQGRSGEFTSKGARQRKEVLGDILNLVYYDRMREGARIRLRNANEDGERLVKQLDILDSSLAERPNLDAELAAVAAKLESATQSSERSERKLQELREQVVQRDRAALQREELMGTGEKLAGRQAVLEKEQAALLSQHRADREILGMADAIQRDYDCFKQLLGREANLKKDLETLRRVETELHTVDAKVAAGRHQVERSRDKCEARLDALRPQLAELDSLLDRQEEVKTSAQELDKVRASEKELRQRRAQHGQLQEARDCCLQDIQLEEKRLRAESDLLAARIDSLKQRQRELSSIDKQMRTLEEKLDQLEKQALTLVSLRETLTSLRAELQRSKLEREQLEVGFRELQGKVDILDDVSDPTCPLCGSDLDAVHRQSLSSELTVRTEQQQRQIQDCTATAESLKGKIATTDARIDCLVRELEPLDNTRQELANLKAEIAMTTDLERELGNLAEMAAAIEAALQKGDFALEARLKLDAVNGRLMKVDYQESHHSEARQLLEQLAGAEGELARLHEVQSRAEQIRRDCSNLEAERQKTLTILRKRQFAADEQQLSEALRRQISSLGYDPTEHEAVRATLDGLGDPVGRRETLLLAQQRETSSRESEEAIASEMADLAVQIHQGKERLSSCDETLERLADLNERLEKQAHQVTQQRMERDALLQQQGSLQAQIDQCTDWEKERRALAKQVGDMRNQAWTYRQLADAFGKDGIQALIIENAIPEIELEANDILGRLTNNRIQISIESLRDLKKGGTTETLDIKIADEVGERSYNLYSGGEAFRTDFALRIALSKVLARRAGTQLRTLIIDEGFGTQDSEGLDYLIQAIQEISKDFDKLIVVTHLPELKNAFPTQIHVTKHPEFGSRFEIIENA